jgi:SAM-dependent methyltransferase
MPAKALLRRVVPAPARNHLRKTLLRWGWRRYGLPTADRRALEQIILPDLARRSDIQRVLFVGVAWYTESYERFFFRKRAYWTLDIEPAQALFGAPGGRHIVDSAANVSAHFAEGCLDLIICNGVFGWGLDDRDDVERAFDGFYRALRPAGVFLLGWNDIPPHTPFLPDDTAALRRFKPYTFRPLGTECLCLPETDNQHTYSFYSKPDAISLPTISIEGRQRAAAITQPK